MECSIFYKCSAPICPEDEESFKSIWYPSEDICTARRREWITAQRKIAKRTRYSDTYYTYEMLTRGCIIKTGIKGIDPERDYEDQLKIWLKNHKPKRELTEEERKVIKIRLNPEREV